ncbi:MAG: hypothetical protein IPL46_18455 [Saprospiraceae bacterium]|nr:hypothetical protein [Saprospiraceae bacterium]
MYENKLKIFLAIILFSHFDANAQKSPEPDQFLYAILELHKQDAGDQFTAEFKITKVVNQKLRIPTRSEPITATSENLITFQITDESSNVLDEIRFNDPFAVSHEYVNDEGQLAQITIQENSRSILIRRPISSKATRLSLSSGSTKRSGTSFTQKFR